MLFEDQMAKTVQYSTELIPHFCLAFLTQGGRNYEFHSSLDRVYFFLQETDMEDSSTHFMLLFYHLFKPEDRTS